MNQRSVVFKWRHFEPHIILCAVRSYLRFSLSYREVAELLLKQRPGRAAKDSLERITAAMTVKRRYHIMVRRSWTMLSNGSRPQCVFDQLPLLVLPSFIQHRAKSLARSRAAGPDA